MGCFVCIKWSTGKIHYAYKPQNGKFMLIPCFTYFYRCVRMGSSLQRQAPHFAPTERTQFHHTPDDDGLISCILVVNVIARGSADQLRTTEHCISCMIHAKSVQSNNNINKFWKTSTNGNRENFFPSTLSASNIYFVCFVILTKTIRIGSK
jgi:hypothetical protein